MAATVGLVIRSLQLLSPPSIPFPNERERERAEDTRSGGRREEAWWCCIRKYAVTLTLGVFFFFFSFGFSVET